MRELFIYYRVAAANAAAAMAAAHAWQLQLKQQHPALNARLLRRPETHDGRETWMETYSIDPTLDAGGVSLALQTEIEAGAATALGSFIDGSRHTEVFVACAW